MATKATVTVFLFLSLFGLNTSLNRKHYYVNKSMTWSDARLYCQNYYYDLSTISKDELQPLSDNRQITEDLYWIGLRGHNLLSFWWWTWTGGEVATDIQWDNQQPNYNGEYCCAVKKSSSKVHDVDCDWLMPFYCMDVLDLTVVQQESTWEEALLYCRQNYKDLATLNSDELMKEARVKSSAALTDDLWIGLRFIAGHWFWANGEDFEYKVWSSGEELQCPAMNQRCAVLNRTSMVWKPVDCEQRFSFLCANKP
ncbi:putative C-type lectin domain family 20 member A [Carassius gibelio]|uniref:putative C-type lectin domain family 20 member A n=1 Tax=Carassius gibelio TaxID=101364 RepID=UPI0022793817|nr:putative C-type lectin domain family 20 member A [Carassius gibelio]